MISHSDFAQTLQNGAVTGLDSIIRLASRGVAPEGGIVTNADQSIGYVAQPPSPSSPLDDAHKEVRYIRDKDTANAPHIVDYSHYDSSFKWGKKSLAEQKGVKPELISVANLALRYSTQDMIFYDGVRTIEEQKANLAAGTTRTLQSKHLKQKDGFGHAMDLVPIIGGLPKWDWEGCYRIACAVDRAATELGFAYNITWGAVWDMTLGDFGGDLGDYKKAVMDYQARHPGPDFIDGPHFQWRD